MKKPLCYDHRERAEPPRLCHVCQRIGVEHDIAERTIAALFAAQYTILVDNGENDDDSGPTFDYRSTTVADVMAAMFETDDEYLMVSGGIAGKGWIRFVYGNDGYDVISDYTVNLESVLAPVNSYADTLAT